MAQHPIESIMTSTMESIRDMVDVNTVIGDPVVAGDGSTVIPISKVCFGFVAGGGEYECAKAQKMADNKDALPFAGGSGAGVTVSPMGFLVVSDGQVRLLPAQYYQPLDRIIELAPQALNKLQSWIEGMQKKDACAKPDVNNATS